MTKGTSIALIVICAGALAMAGCLWQRPALPYQYRQEGYRDILQPPGARSARPVQLSVRLARGAPCTALAASFNFTASAPGLALQWSIVHRRLDVRVTSAIATFGGGGLPVDLLNGIHGLHASLDDAVARGCLTRARVSAILRQMADSLPMTPAMAQNIVLGAYATQTYIDVADPVELQMTFALRSDQPERYDLGYAAQTYRLVSTAPDGRGRLMVVASEIKNAAARPRPPAPPVDIGVGDGAAFYRMFFYLRLTPTQHDVALVSAASRAALERATALLLSRPGACRALAVASARCTLMPPGVGLEARLRVRIEGRPTTVAVTATVGAALAAAGVRDPARVLPTLRVLRPYGSRLAPVVAVGAHLTLLNLLLSGGERISWQPLPPG